MHTSHCTATGVVHVLERLVPCQGFSGAARHTGHTGYRAGCRVARKMLGKNRSIVVFFFISWRVDGEPLGGMCHLLVTNLVRGDLLEGVDPRVANTVAKLLFLSPCHLFGLHVGKSLAHDTFLNGLARTHLCLRVGAHGHIKKLLVEERHATFHTPCRQTFVGTKAVVHVEF